MAKQWRVVLDAEKPPTCGDWLAASGMGPADKETVRFTFIDGTGSGQNLGVVVDDPACAKVRS